MRTGPHQLLVAALVVGLLASGALVVTADSEFDLTLPGAIDTPEQTVEIEGSEYTVDGIAPVEPGEAIDITVSSSERYNLYLYDESGNSQYNVYNSPDESQLTIGTDDDDLDTGALDAGTYVLSLEPDGEGRVAVFPVVIQGYDLTLEADSTGEEIELAATADPTHASGQPDELRVALWDGDDTTDVSLEHTEGTSYETVIDADELGEGVYDTYVAVPGDEADGFPTALAIESGETLTVSSDEGDEPDDGNGGDEDDPEDGEDENGDDEDGEDGEDESGDDKVGEDDDAGSDEDGTADSGNGNESDGDDDDGQSVLEPNNESERGDSSDQDGLGTPGASLIGTVAVLSLVGYAVARRDR